MSAPVELEPTWNRVCDEGQFHAVVESARPGHASANVILATDASMTGWGVNVIELQSMNVLSRAGGPWCGRPGHDLLISEKTEHIFYKELKACLFGLCKLDADAKAVIVVDNAASHGYFETVSAKPRKETICLSNIGSASRKSRTFALWSHKIILRTVHPACQRTKAISTDVWLA